MEKIIRKDSICPVRDESWYSLLIKKYCPYITALGSINIGSDEFQNLKKSLSVIYQPEKLTCYSDYIKRNINLRISPEKLFPWAKSFVFTLLPFRILPKKNPFLPLADSDSIYGKIAGYAALFDYHLITNPTKYFCSNYPEIADSPPFNLPRNLKEALCQIVGDNVKVEFFSDTKPVAERLFAYYTQLGRIGMNHSILCRDEGSGCFIIGAAVDKELPDIHINRFARVETVRNIAAFEETCKQCLKCIENCPSHAINENIDNFVCNRCISWLTMEKKGKLSEYDAALIDNWIWGCDRCTAVCPETKLPTAVKVDIIKILNMPSNELKRLIECTPLSYGGVKLLKRNIKAILK